MKLEDEELHEENANQKIHRKIVFDTVNEILVRKFSPQGLFTLGRKRLSLEELPKEVHLELNRLQRKKDCSQDDEDDGFVRILTEDMKHQSADWAEYTCEIPALVLDIERLIFKDLINEVVTGEVMGLHN
ncbi:Protein LONGIFOLIA 2 [Forsythia ovata]|uniref:Protein LONGIFOLIA 2 n=1 Tax=Forsythia ovata TaxID=205694 RepID=A0ABD1UDD4_9LAMI